MFKQVMLVVFLIFMFSFSFSMLWAQENASEKDTFFLAKKKGILGKLGKSLNTDPAPLDAVKVVNPFIFFEGKTIRSIKIVRLGFEKNIFDTSVYKNSFGAILANGFHRKTTPRVINNNLFFKQGDKIHPYLLADNERHLRDQIYIQDARILIDSIQNCSDSVDVFVITKDIFPLGGSINMSSATKIAGQIRNENVGGSGSQLSFSSLYDKDRNPNFGYDAGFLKRNILGSFIDWSVGIQTYRGAFNSGRSEETYVYTHFERPLVTPYIPWIGAVDIAMNKTSNNYISDSLYKSDFKYSYRNIDAWYGYNFGSKGLLYKKKESRVKKFVALRGFSQQFTDIPYKNIRIYDYRYANIEGVLGAFTVFKQDPYRANFIYGFGINEDVPEGYSASLISGWTKKEGRSRPYYGFEGIKSHFSKNGFFSTYTFRIGGFSYQKKLEDIDILLNVDHFTRLKKLGPKWYTRNFFSAGFTKQISPTLSQPLNLNSIYGLNYFRGDPGPADVRSTIKAETVFYHLRKFWGFKMAPFIFGDLSMLTPINQQFNKSDLFSAVGAGVRTRNENLTFGTIELRGYFFPRTLPGMKNYKVEVSTSIRFKYNSIFIRKPDFVASN
jgi:hypothetical protein